MEFALTIWGSMVAVSLVVMAVELVIAHRHPVQE